MGTLETIFEFLAAFGWTGWLMVVGLLFALLAAWMVQHWWRHKFRL